MKSRYAFAVTAIYVLGMMFDGTALAGGGSGGSKKTTLFKVRNSGTAGDLGTLVYNTASPPALTGSSTLAEAQKAGCVLLNPGAQASFKVAPQPTTIGAAAVASGSLASAITSVWQGTPVKGTNYASIASTGTTVVFDNGSTKF